MELTVNGSNDMEQVSSVIKQQAVFGFGIYYEGARTHRSCCLQRSMTMVFRLKYFFGAVMCQNLREPES